jgi:hypothetical protein
MTMVERRFSIAGAALIAALFPAACPLFAQDTDTDRRPLRVEVLSPGPEAEFRAEAPNAELRLNVVADSGLARLDVEVTGAFTGTFFTICGGDAAPCEGDAPQYDISASLPVFEGANTVVLRATDNAGNVTRAQQTFTVQLIGGSTDVVPVDPSGRDRFDLLILTHKNPDGEDFAAALEPLLQHKNATGMRTKLWTLEEIYETPQFRGHDHPEIIKKAIYSAARRWGVKYVMLVGDSDRFPIRYIRIYDLGHWGHGFVPSDLYYADLNDASGAFESWDSDGDHIYGEGQGNFPANMQDLNQDDADLIPDVAVGRVPASSLAELETYVSKIIRYESSASADWFRNALLVTGDYPNSNGTNDAIGNDLSTQGFALDKQYHDAVWPGTTMPQRYAIIENALDSGAGFVSYVGHGGGVGAGKNGGVWGGWYDYSRIPNLANADRLPVIFSAACETGMFHFGNGPYYAKQGHVYDTPVSPPKYRWAPEPISYSPSLYDKDALAEHFLVKQDVGAIAFIGAYTGTQGDSHTLARGFFKSYANGSRILGDAWNGSLTAFVNGPIASLSFPGSSWYTYARWSHVNKMLLFGDPSLRIGGLAPDLVPIAPSPTGFCTVRNGQLVVRVQNVGSGVAGPSSVKVDFFSHGQASRQVGTLNPNQYADVLVPIPAGCSDPDCNFVIEVDAGAAISESDETNNRAQGICPG